MPRRHAESLYSRFQKIKHHSLSDEDLLKFATGYWKSLDQTRRVYRRIKREFLKEEELVFLELRAMSPPKLDKDIAFILGISQNAVCKRRQKIYAMITSYSWWIQNERHICNMVTRRLSKFHLKILLSVIHRRTQHQIAKELGISESVVQDKMKANRKLLNRVRGFDLFLKSLRMKYRRPS